MARGFAPCALLCSAWIVACAGTEETLITTTLDGGAGGAPSNGLPAVASFQIQLTGTLDDSVDADVYDIDLHSTSERQLDSLHAAGRSVGCYFSAGTLETFRDDARDVPDALVGKPHPDYPQERWLDVRSDVVKALMVARIELGRAKGCDAVHPANVSVFAADSGFSITQAENAAFATALAAAAHERGLAVAWSDEPGEFPELEKTFDWGIAIQCVEYGRCSRWLSFRDARKPVFVVEIGTAADASRVCAAAGALGLGAVIKDSNYTAFRVGCP